MTQKKTYRIEQVNRLLQEQIAEILLTDLQDERLKQLTLTEVRTSKDLQHAVVFLAMRKSADSEEILASVQRGAGFIRKLLYSRIRLKHIPELDFRYDDSIDRAENLFRKLNRIRDEIEEFDRQNDEEQST